MTQSTQTQPALTEPGFAKHDHAGGIGDSPQRPDGTLKVKGEFAYSSDLWLDDALFGVTLRSPYPRARITKIDLTGAVATHDVYAVLTHEDVPGSKFFGLDDADQPVLAIGEVRYQGEPVVILAAADPHTARRALEKIVVEYEELPPLTDARTAVFDETAIDVIPKAMWCGTNRSGMAIPTRRRRRSWWSANTRSVCRIRPSSVRSRGWRCRRPTAASTSSWRRSGCTPTGSRSRRASDCRRRRCG